MRNFRTITLLATLSVVLATLSMPVSSKDSDLLVNVGNTTLAELSITLENRYDNQVRHCKCVFGGTIHQLVDGSLAYTTTKGRDRANTLKTTVSETAIAFWRTKGSGRSRPATSEYDLNLNLPVLVAGVNLNTNYPMVQNQ